jgi:arylsulfatase A-like enzyme
VPLLRNAEVIERPAEQHTLTRRYTEEAVQFIQANRKRPFFLYLPHTFPHVPLFASGDFAGRSLRGLYGDVVEELDWSVGQVLQTLRDAGLDRRTMVVFSSDNGPWLTFNEQGGSAGLLRDGKGSTWEGGMRVPGIFWWPGKIPAGNVTQEMASTLDVFPTCVKLAGGDATPDPARPFDGYDISPVLFGQGPSPRDTMFYYRGTRLYAVRKGAFKAHFLTQTGYGQPKPEEHNPPLLYNLLHDPGERYDVAKDHNEALAEIARVVETHRAGMQPAESRLEKLLPAAR